MGGSSWGIRSIWPGREGARPSASGFPFSATEPDESAPVEAGMNLDVGDSTMPVDSWSE